ncbi:MAG: hypothetical protein Q4D31_02965 [Eubacteriales bacterium]|nr:hypothetical protein [Eubacteriales bacterium]
MGRRQDALFARLQASLPALEPLELLPADAADAHFCTPCGARLLARIGVDGVHFCDVPAYGDTVFAVSPMGETPYVCAVADDLTDLLREVLSCGSVSAVEQLAWMDAARAHDFLRFDRILRCGGTPEELDAACRWFGMDTEMAAPDVTFQAAHRHALDTLRTAFDLTPIEDVYAHIQSVRGKHDLGALRFSEGYEELTGK